MLKKSLFLAAGFVFTNLLSVVLTFNFGHIINDAFIGKSLIVETTEKEKEEQGDVLTKKNGKKYKIHIGVLLPKNIITGNNREDSEMAKGFIHTADDLSCISSGDMQGERGFVFQGSVCVDD